LYWGDQEDAPSPRFQILGNPTPGTYSEHVIVPIENLAHKPAHLDFRQAAALPLEGLTAWRALYTQGGLQPGQTVLIPGIGGGVAGLALAFAKRTGARALVTSSSVQKLKDAREAGADGGVNYRDADWQEQMRRLAGPEGIDLVIDSSGAQTLPAAVHLVKPVGRIVFFGATTGPQVALTLRDLFFRQVRLIGTTMGSPREFEALFRFIAASRYVPDVRHVYPLAEAPAAHALMETGGQFGKIVLDIP
jgi:NADPH:quinone reductase-like Zn-dependent oxidoreductase